MAQDVMLGGPLSRIVLATIGSLGDLHPMIAIGLALKARGHVVVIATSGHYHGRLRQLGFEVHGLRPDTIKPTDVDTLAQLMDLKKGSGMIIRDYIFPAIDETYDDLKALVTDADALVVSELLYAGRPVAEIAGIPWIFLALSPSSFFSIYDMPTLPGRENLAFLHKLGPAFNRMLVNLAKLSCASWPAPYHALRRRLGLPPQGNPIFEEKFSPHLVLAAFSELMGKRQRDWPANTVVTGFAYHDSTPDLFDRDRVANIAKMESFLAEGEPPVVFTLGSAAMFVPGDFYHESLKAAKLLKCRAIFLMGQNQLFEDLPPGMLAFDYLPFQDIFPRAAAIVHQGGIGTSAQGLRSGVPTICVPFSHDQPDNARRLEELGTSITIKRSLYKAELVAEKLQVLRNNKYFNTRARQASQILEQENGAEAAAQAIERAIKSS